MVAKPLVIAKFFLSLQATWIRNSILRALRETAPEVAKRLPTSFVYEYPTVDRMVGYMCKAVLNPAMNQRLDLVTRGKALQALVDKYTVDFPPRPLANGNGHAFGSGQGDVYLVTGTTGGLGSNILSQLLASASVSRVYAFNRPSSYKTSAARHTEAFVKRGLDESLLASPKLVCVEGDLNAPGFGIDVRDFAEVNTCIHMNPLFSFTLSTDA